MIHGVPLPRDDLLIVNLLICALPELLLNFYRYQTTQIAFDITYMCPMKYLMDRIIIY
jgi:hypothetical protein